MRLFRQFRLGTKLLLLQGLAFLVIAPLLVWLLRGEVTRLSENAARRTGEETAQLLAVISSAWAQEGKRAQLSAVYRDWTLRDPQKYVYIMWVGPDGTAWAHSTLAEVGKQLQDPLSIVSRQLQHPQTDLDTLLRDEERVTVWDIKVPIRLGEKALGGLRLGIYPDSTERDGAGARNLVTWLAILFLGIFLLAALAAGHVLLAPVRDLLKGSGHLLDGELETRLAQSSEDELGQLAWNINQLAERLQGALARIEQLATTDGLTQVYNYYYFQVRLAEELIRSQRYSRPVSLLLIDVDDFRRLNDQYGHAAGDAVLWEVAQMIRKSVRQSDLVARYAGTQFTVLLTETDLAEAEVVAEKIRRSAEVKAISFARGEVASAATITISVGLAGFPATALNKDDLVAQAKIALQKAKERGKNCFVRYQALG